MDNDILKEIVKFSTQEENTEREIIKSNNIVLDQEISKDSVKPIIEYLLSASSEAMAAGKLGDDVTILINSPGGNVSAGLSLIDIIHFVSRTVTVNLVAMGEVCSMAAFIVASGIRGNRFILPNTSIMLHNVSTNIEGELGYLNNEINYINKLNMRLIKLAAVNSGIKVGKLTELMKKDLWLTAKEAIDLGKYGLVDEIVFSPYDIFGV